jgi:hypothetical protein
MTIKLGSPTTSTKSSTTTGTSLRRNAIVPVFLGVIAGGRLVDERDWVVNFPTFTTQQKSDPPPHAVDDRLSNPHYGWQPKIPETMDCSWRECFQDLHNCSTCRDSVEDFGTAPEPPDNWIPDVTMLHRMMLAGKDANGPPWPPSLDLELCEDIGTDDGSTIDIGKKRELQKKPGVVTSPSGPSPVVSEPGSYSNLVWLSVLPLSHGTSVVLS